jgi:predicted acetylornithine/succinylornithine family transaminase
MPYNLENLKNDDEKYLFQNYGNRLPACFVRGNNSYLYDQDNKEYIDFLSGIAVSSLGYAHPELTKALHEQVDKVLHTSNYFFNHEQIEAAKLLSELAFTGKTLFVNSGTEANEAAIKLARKHGAAQNRHNIITFSKSFHGRTFGSMSATANPKIHEGFGPLLEGFTHLPFNDITKFDEEIAQNKTCAVLFEVVQGEGGIILANKDFVQHIYKQCKEHNILLIIDEIQTGIGRTGKPFGFQHYEIQPDIITLAKGISAGLPLGAIHVKEEISKLFTPGSHGTTFGGNHLACKAAGVVLKTLKEKSFLDNINKVSRFFFDKLNELKSKFDIIKDVRGLGLHIGIELTGPGNELVKKALAKGLILNCTANCVIRIMPPLIINEETALKGLNILEEILAADFSNDSN